MAVLALCCNSNGPAHVCRAPWIAQCRIGRAGFLRRVRRQSMRSQVVVRKRLRPQQCALLSTFSTVPVSFANEEFWPCLVTVAASATQHSCSSSVHAVRCHVRALVRPRFVGHAPKMALIGARTDQMVCIFESILPAANLKARRNMRLRCMGWPNIHGLVSLPVRHRLCPQRRALLTQFCGILATLAL